MDYIPSYSDTLRADIQPSYRDSISHHGIKGMKWGVRRFEDASGHLTPAGKERYYGKYGNHRTLNAGGLFSKKQKIEDDPNYDPVMGLVKQSGPHDMKSDYYGVNPNYSKSGKYQMNCTKCAVAYDLRRRGYNVQAGPSRVPINETVTDQFYKNAKKDMVKSVGADGHKPIVDRLNPDPKDVQFYLKKAPQMAKKNPEEYKKLQKDHAANLAKQCESYGPGARGAINMNFTNGFGHCISFENDKNGKVQFVDTQTAGVMEKVRKIDGYGGTNSQYYKTIIEGAVNPYVPISVTRYDNAQPNLEFMKANQVLENPKGYK